MGLEMVLGEGGGKSLLVSCKHCSSILVFFGIFLKKEKVVKMPTRKNLSQLNSCQLNKLTSTIYLHVER